MAPIDIKKVPKWAWYASAGVVTATVGYRVWSNRGGGEEVVAETVDGDVVGGGVPTTGNPVGAVPVFIGGGSTNDSTGDSSWIGAIVSSATDLASQALGSANKTTETIADTFVSNNKFWQDYSITNQSDFRGFIDGVLVRQNDVNLKILDTMSAGESPAAVTIVPQVATQVPVVNGTVPANPAASSAPAGFPKQNKSNGKWYKEAVATSQFKDSNGNTVKKGQGYNQYQDGTKVKD